VPSNVKAVCKAEKTCRSRRQTNRATNRIVCPQYRHQRCHSGAKATEATVGLQSSSTVECRLKAFVRRQCRRSESGLQSGRHAKAEDRPTERPTESASVSTPTLSLRRRQRRRRYFRSSSTVECRLKAFVRRQCRRMKAGKRKTCKAEDRPTATNRIVCPQYRHQRAVTQEAKATETQ
jgi:hypothetical protein